jgi:hypothetical protein
VGIAREQTFSLLLGVPRGTNILPSSGNSKGTKIFPSSGIPKELTPFPSSVNFKGTNFFLFWWEFKGNKHFYILVGILRKQTFFLSSDSSQGTKMFPF